MIIHLLNYGEYTELTISLRQVHELAKVSRYFKNVERDNALEPIVELDFREYELNVFLFFLDAVLSDRTLTPTSNLNVENFDSLLVYLGVERDIDLQLSINAEVLVSESLHPVDRQLRYDELQLREKLFANEETDFRLDDIQFRFPTICAQLNYPLDPNASAQAGQLEHIPDEDEQGYFWGLFGPFKMCPYHGGDFRTRPGFFTCYRDERYDNTHDPDYNVLPGPDYPRIGKLRPIKTATTRYLRVPALFHQETQGVFQDFDFTDLVVAGGSFFTLLTGYHGVNGDMASKIINDLDIFIITKDPERADNAIRRVLNLLYHEGDNTLILHTEHSITVEHHGLRVQIILRLYNSIAQVLSGFDLDSATIGFDGQHLYCMPRFVRMLLSGANLVDPERQSRSFSFRLMKYLRRGVGLLLPGYNKNRILPTSTLLRKPSGLVKLLRTYRNFLKSRKIVGQGLRDEAIKPDDEILTEENDYDVLYPNALTLTDVMGSISQRATAHWFSTMSEEQRRNIPNEEYSQIKDDPIKYLREYDMLHVPYQLTSSIESLFTGIQPADGITPDLIYDLPPGVNYRIRNPGTQITNSFYPTSEDWFRDAYVMETDPRKYEGGIDEEEVESADEEQKDNGGLD
jgi:hypothetical protein